MDVYINDCMIRLTIGKFQLLLIYMVFLFAIDNHQYDSWLVHTFFQSFIAKLYNVVCTAIAQPPVQNIKFVRLFLGIEDIAI